MSGVIQRTQYRNVNTGTIRTGATGHGESVTDVEGYLRPLEEERTAALLGFGVARGLEIIATVGAHGLKVQPGVAIDRAGRTVALTAGGVAVVVPELEPGQVVDVPTVSVPAPGIVLDTTHDQGDFVLTATWQEAQDESALANAPVLLHAPWLRLVPEADFDEDGDSIALAFVGLDADGVTALDPGPRRRIALRTGRIELEGVDTLDVNPESGVGTAHLATLEASTRDGVALDLVSGAAAPVRALRVDPDSGQVHLPEGTVTSVLRTEAADDVAHEIRSRDDGSWDLTDSGENRRLTVDAFGNIGVGIGDEIAQRSIHVEGSEIHSGGGGGGFSFADRNSGTFVDGPPNGERWVWYALGGAARLWSGWDRLSVSASGEGGGLDVGRRMRVRQGGDNSAGIWMWQDAVGDRAFVGMASDTNVGLYGVGSGWGLQMDTNSGVVQFSSAVVVNQDLHVRGRIFKGGGAFRIDHPLAPAEKFLSHSFVESPEMTTLYTGTVTTDGTGRASVELPGYFDALNKDARVQLTTVDSFSAVTLEAQVCEGTFTVRSADPGVTVNWLVTGVRQDVWAEANRIQVEEDKTPEERGQFLHASEHGQPADAALAHPHSPSEG